MPIRLSGARVDRDALLVQAIENMKYPVTLPYIYALRRVIEPLLRIPAAHAILTSPVRALRATDICDLFFHLEQLIAQWNVPNPYKLSADARIFFMRLPVPLGDGFLVGTSGFRPAFPYPARNREKATLAGEYNKDSMPAATQKPASTIDYDTPKELRERFHDTAVARQEVLAQKCQLVFDLYDELVARIKQLKKSGQEELGPNRLYSRGEGRTLFKRTLKKMSEDEHFRAILLAIDRDKFYLTAPPSAGGLRRISELTKYTTKVNSKRCFELAVADYYLPRIVIAACVIAISTATILNTDTITSLTRRSVTATADGYQLVGLKGKTDQIQTRELSPVESELQAPDDERIVFVSKVSVRAMDLLLWHAAQIERNFNLEDVPLLSSMSLTLAGPHRFFIHDLNESIQDFCDFVGLKRFSTRDLRDLGAQAEYLSPQGSLHSVGAKLGHKSLATTALYVRTAIQRLLNQANMRRFMKKIAATMLWRTNRNGELSRHRIDPRHIDQNLLFPASDTSDGPSVVDQWLEADSSVQLRIGLDELEMCAWQFHLYQKNMNLLASQNADAFIQKHLPRILFCYSLRKVLLASQHAGLYRSIEKQYQNPGAQP